MFIYTGPQTFLHQRIYVAFMTTIPAPTILALGLTLLIIAGEMDLSFPSVMVISGLAFATIGTQFFWRGASTLFSDGLALNLNELRVTSLHGIMVGRLWGWIPMQTIWCLLLAFLFWLILNRHIFGDDIRFIGDDIRTAETMGVRTLSVRMGLFVLMGVISALASVMVCFEMANWWPTQGEGYLLIVFAAVFLGGTSVFGGEGTIFGTVIGSIIIGILEAGIISAGLSGYWTRLVYGLVIVLSVSIYAAVFNTRRT